MNRITVKIQEITDILGEEAAIALIQRWGGVSVFIPTSGPGVKILGPLTPENQAYLRKKYGGRYFAIPSVEDLANAKRDAEIRERRSATPRETIQSLADNFGLSCRQIYRIVSSR